MFNVNDVVVYGNSDVCCVKEINRPDFVQNEDFYYYLQPVCNTASTIYIKISDTTKYIRPIITKERAEELLGNLPELDGLYDHNDKIRDKEYREVISSCDYEKNLLMLKGIITEKHLREKKGKKLNMNDERNLHRVENCLAAETSMCFHITMSQAKEKLYNYLP